MRFEITTLLILPKRVYLCNIMFTALAFGSIFVVAGGGGGGDLVEGARKGKECGLIS